jgi:hypothetical protein
MSVKSCDNCTITMVNYVNLWLIHSHVASLLDGARLKFRELKAVEFPTVVTRNPLIVWSYEMNH